MNKALKLIFTLFLSGVLLNSRIAIADAQVAPDFPTCSNPQGTIRVQYSEGVHGIAGSSSEFSGSDTVYDVDDITHIQCFCSEDGDGIQTNWWKVSSLSQQEIDVLRNLGWAFIPSGLTWGLDDSSYFAQNKDYACGGSDSSSDDNNDSGNGEVLGTSTSSDQEGAVLGLAATGNSLALYTFLIAGLIFVVSGKFLKIKAKKQN